MLKRGQIIKALFGSKRTFFIILNILTDIKGPNEII